jgi:hypothetical protein
VRWGCPFDLMEIRLGLLGINKAKGGYEVRREKPMKLTQEQRQEIEKIASGLNCSKDLICYKSGLEKLCKARDFGMEKYIDCLEENPENCEFSLPFGEGHLCKCALRIYIAQNLKK